MQAKSSRPLIGVGVLLTLAVTTGCQTTGDPTQGGLFGWSESKAMDRQAQLRNQLNNSLNSNADSSARSRRLGVTVSNLNADISAKSAMLQNLNTEITNLKSQIEAGTVTPDQARSRLADLQKQAKNLPPVDSKTTDRVLDDVMERIKLMNN